MRDKAEELQRRVEERIRFLSDLGAGFVFRPEKREPAEAIAPAQDRAAVAFPVTGNAEEADKASVLRPLEEAVRRCTLCRLAEGRRHAVPGEGTYDAPLMFVGEGPGADEDLQGRPFVGRAGQLLTKIIAAMKFTQGRGLHHERRQMPPSRQPHALPRRDRGLPALSPDPDPDDPAARHRRARPDGDRLVCAIGVQHERPQGEVR